MTGEKSQTGAREGPKTGAQARADRLAQALRDNLKRRKTALHAPREPGEGAGQGESGQD